MILIDAGHGNRVAVPRIVALLEPGSAPIRRLRQEAAAAGKLVDATKGGRTRCILLTDSDHLILVAETADELARRIEAAAAGGTGA